jgi:hypothetical protein
MLKAHNRAPKIRAQLNYFGIVGAQGADNPAMVALYKAGAALGLSTWQLTQICKSAYHASSGYDWHLIGCAQGLRMATRAKHAAENPRGKWALLSLHYGDAFQMDDGDPRALNWSSLPDTK